MLLLLHVKNTACSITFNEKAWKTYGLREFSTFIVFDFKIHINRTLIVFVTLPEQRAGVLLEGIFLIAMLSFRESGLISI